MTITPTLLSVNTGTPRPIDTQAGVSAIDKRPVAGPVRVDTPVDDGAVGVEGDHVVDTAYHGGPDQAVYAYAREDLDRWESEVGGALVPGAFGENFTTLGVDVCGAELGETWRVGADLVVRVTKPRTPCRAFAAHLARAGWVKAFTRAARTGAYLRVVRPGLVRAGDPVTVVDRPGHGVTVSAVFRAMTLEPGLLPGLLAAGAYLPSSARARVEARSGGSA
ncbi:MOSC domain-containing protein [Actinokineospora auranticolor]|uniref:MOSC domain-containing protein YiiM n=1 Tax=Actinokineospora auranticolor TaxID=155976 RepID=A0A2S6GNG4_9PSEU|nr:MOSC domain-containing protein [Actinokineospora auranticolor]PPK66775.1 MOSC domain-containing protein YiiM [Actinokineospora auranticolor]